MNVIRSFVIFALIFGFISSSSSESNFLVNICFQFHSCRSDDAYLKLQPVYFNPNVYDYTIDIPSNYPFYSTTSPMRVEFYVMMNVSNIDDLNNGKISTAKSVLYGADGKEILAITDLAYLSNEMLLISAELSFEVKNETETKLIVYRFNDGTVRQSEPYTLTFKRNK